MKKLKRVLALCLAAACIITAFAACGGDDDDDGAGDTPNPGNTQTPSSEYVYVASFTNVKSNYEISGMSSMCFAGDYLYFVSSMVDGKETYTDETTGESWEYDLYVNKLFRLDVNSQETIILENYEFFQPPEGSQGNSYINNICISPDGGIWVLENYDSYYYNLPDNFDPETDYEWNYYVSTSGVLLNKIDETGKILETMPITGNLDPDDPYAYFYINSFTIGGDGNMYYSDNNGDLIVAALDGSGSFTLKSSGWINRIVTFRDGRVGAMYYEESAGGYVLKTVDAATKDWGDTYETPYDAYYMYTGSGEYDFYYQSNSNFFGYKLDSGENVKLFNFINSDVNPDNLSSIVPLEDESFMCVSYSWEDSSTEIIRLVKTPANEVPQKTVINLACVYLDYYLRSEILKFNKTNGTYRINVTDYAEYNTSDDYTAGITKLTTEIISGSVPDILCTSNMPMSRFAAKGLLEDLWPYIESDAEIGGRDALMTQALNAASIDGKLYSAFSSFGIYTAVADGNVVGNGTGWTLDEMYQALQSLPAGAEIASYYNTKADMLQTCCMLGMNDFVDWSTGTCTFNSGDFKDMLEFANLFPLEFDWENYEWSQEMNEYYRLMSGTQLLSSTVVSDFDTFCVYDSILNGNANYIGFPTESRNGNAFYIDSGMAISSRSANKDGAWAFVRTVLTEEYQTNNVWWRFATNAKVFNQKLEDAMEPVYYTDVDENGNEVQVPTSKYSWWITDDIQVEINSLTQEQADKIMDLIDRTDRIYTYDESLYNIISDSVAPYFAGQKTLDDTVNLIQSRVSLYVNEQR